MAIRKNGIGIKSRGLTYYELILFWKIEILEKRPPPMFVISRKKNNNTGLEKAHPRLFKFPQKDGFERSLIWEQLPRFISQLSATLMFF